MRFTDLPPGSGVSLKPEYFGDAATLVQSGMWFEVHSENYMIDGGPRLHGLLDTAAKFPISLHGVGASLGGPGLPAADHLRELVRLVNRVNPAAVSEHAAWSMVPGRYFAELLPLPRTSEALARLSAGVNHLQEAIKRTILIENPSNYLPVVTEMDEPDFLVEVSRRTGCGLLLDVNNVYVSANNCGTDPHRYITALPADLIGEIHVAGFSPDANLGDRLLIDSHAAPISEPVWQLLEFALKHTGPVPVLVERDADLPAFVELMRERARAHHLVSNSTTLKQTHVG